MVFCAVLAAALLVAIGARGDQTKYSGPARAAPVDEFFANQVWAKVGTRCLECHKAGGDAEESDFVLLDPQLSTQPEQIARAFRPNRAQLAAMGRRKARAEPRRRSKPPGQPKLGGRA